MTENMSQSGESREDSLLPTSVPSSPPDISFDTDMATAEEKELLAEEQRAQAANNIAEERRRKLLMKKRKKIDDTKAEREEKAAQLESLLEKSVGPPSIVLLRNRSILTLPLLRPSSRKF
jgi:ATP-dependent DNA helicase